MCRPDAKERTRIRKSNKTDFRKKQKRKNIWIWGFNFDIAFKKGFFGLGLKPALPNLKARLIVPKKRITCRYTFCVEDRV